MLGRGSQPYSDSDNLIGRRARYHAIDGPSEARSDSVNRSNPYNPGQAAECRRSLALFGQGAMSSASPECTGKPGIIFGFLSDPPR